MAALAVAAMAAGARAQEIELEERLQSEASVTVELGRSPSRAGFAIDIAGGMPFSHALLSLEVEGLPAVQHLVGLDENGAKRILERNHTFEHDVTVRCTLNTPNGRVTRSALVPAASTTIQPPATLLGPGDIVITEVMKDPSFVTDANGEWFEIRNQTNHAIDLEGWVLSDAGTNLHTIHGPNGVIVPPRSYFVLGINSNPATNGGITVGYKYSSFALGNGADEIRISDPLGNLIDVVAYDDGIFWPDDAGKSISLDRALVDPLANDDGTNWCSALAAISSFNTDFGTPRVANNICP
jgi:hypothetical protein